MLVGKIFAPKWKHRKADVRKQALLRLKSASQESQQIYNEIARTDPEIEIRKLALKRINDVTQLLDLADSQQNNLGAEINKRLGQLVCQDEVKSDAIERINGYLRQHANPELLKLILSQSTQEALRETALLALDKNATYADTAMSDNSAPLRLLAIEHINKISTLERVLKYTKTRDKAVYKIAKQKLEAHNSEKNRPKQLQDRVDQILIELNAIVKVCQEQSRWAPQQAQVSVLLADWKECCAESVESTTELQDQFDTQYQSYQQGLQQEKADADKLEMEIEDFEPIKDIILEYCDKLRQISVDINNTASRELLRPVMQQAEQITAVWQQILNDMPTIEHSSFMHSTIEQYKSLWQNYQNESKAADVRLRKSEQRKSKIAELQAFTESAKPVTTAVVARYTKNLDHFSEKTSPSTSLNQNDDTKTDRRLYKELLQQLDDQLTSQAAENASRLEELSGIVADLQRALVNGKAKFAVNLTRRWGKIIAAMDATTRNSKKFASLSNEYKKLQPKVSELREWREWSNLPVKERLCQDIELLAEEAGNNLDNIQYNYSAVMEQLKAYRHDWSKLVDSEFKPDKKLEKKFNSACEAISKASQSFFSGLADNRQTHLERRQKYCAELDSYFEKINTLDIADIDAKHLDKVVNVSYKEWHSLGVVDRAKKDDINKQFSNTMSKLTDIRNRIRENNADEKKSLLTRAQKALADIETDNKNVTSSIDAIKRLQSQWKKIGVASKDRELWQEFQQCCNQVFECRNNQNKEKAVIRDQQRKALEELCLSIENLSKNDFESAAQARQQFSELQQQWQTMSAEIEIKGLEKRYKSACQAFEKKMLEQKEQAKKANITAIHKLWDVCVDMEALLANSLQSGQTVDDLETKIMSLQTVGKDISVQSGPYTKALQARFNRLQKQLSRLLSAIGEADGDAAFRAEILEQQLESINVRKKLCLHAEILADVESPGDEMPARMQFQVSMLAKRMTQGGQSNASVADEAVGLLNAWHNTNVVIDPVRSALENRFSGAINKIDAVETVSS